MQQGDRAVLLYVKLSSLLVSISMTFRQMRISSREYKAQTIKNQYPVVYQRTRYRLDDRCSIPGRENHPLYLRSIQTCSWNRHTPVILSPRIKCAGRGDHSPQSCAEIKNEWTCTSTPHISSWRGAEA